MKYWLFAAMISVAAMPSAALAQQDGPPSDEQPSEEQPTDEQAPQQPQQNGAARLTKAPALIESAQAEYTQEAVDARVEGAVNLRLTISATGEVTKVEVLKGLGYGLDEAAVRAARQFVFSPAEVNNQPAAVTLDFAIEFSLPLMPATFKGKLVELESGAAIADATVAIEYLGDEYDPAPRAKMSVEADGTFSFENVPPGKYRVDLSAVGYPDRSETVELGSGDAVQVTYRFTKAPVNLRGEVREAGTRTPLAGIEVRLLEAESGEEVRTTFTDSDATFAFRDLKPGSYQLVFNADGYEPFNTEVVVEKGEVTGGTFYLRAEYYGEYTVKTTARREQTDISRKRIELDELRRIPGTGGDVVRVVQNLPGVARPSYVSGSLIVRGAAPEDTKVFLQGDAIPLVFHFLGGPAVISSEMLEAVDFYPGNFSVYYGRATGGIVALRTRSPRDDRFHGFVEIDLIDATAQIEGPISEDFSFALSARRSYIDALLPIFAPEELTDQVTVSPRYYDYQSWLTWRASEENTLELFVYGSSDEIATVFDDEDEGPRGNANVQISGASFSQLFHRGQVRWAWDPTAEPIENEMLLSFGVNSAGFDVAENLYFFADYYQTQFRNDFRISASDDLKLRVGADIQLGTVDYQLRIPRQDVDRGSDYGGDGNGRFVMSPDGVIADRSAPLMQPAVYAEATYEPIESLQLIPGIRADYYGAIGRTSVSPRFTTRFALTDRVTLKGGVGLFTQPPLPHESDETLGNPDLTFEKAIHYALGSEWRPLDYLEVDATLFYRSMYDLVETTSAVTTNEEGEAENLVFNNAGEGRAYGLELMLRHYPQDHFFGWLAYTLSRAERFDPVDQEYHLFRYDQTHILTLVAGYNLPWQIDISGRFRLVTGSPYTPISGAVWDADQDDYEAVYGTPLSARSATFHQLDVRIDKKFVFDTFILGAYIEVINAYNATNEEGRDYNFDYSKSAPVSGLPIIPTLGVNGRF
jgi:TonB family protein